MSCICMHMYTHTHIHAQEDQEAPRCDVKFNHEYHYLERVRTCIITHLIYSYHGSNIHVALHEITKDVDVIQYSVFNR